ncbi:helix-turn-helix domain-containing protein [Mycolicibacterium arenosum]|uniref:Helix-turn-helix domain-containing protein n=1 Tax=Mycolicibacterium arenosum TaxID=2952157 RepID=A0ABT1MA48_9MYCO|nr:helix-turn-helix domain-containing protein [Mycolicibacterium sp. CAU 1645]MCP9276034.1 helix-turn-helix domain-containing protein [Mycolicibacterium sp. CAU 1645]
MTVIAGTPHPALRDVVLRYEGFEDRRGDPVTFRELPCSFVPIIIDLDAGWTITYGGAPPMRVGSFVAGVTDSVVVVGHSGSARCVQIDLTPLGARRLLGVPMSELANVTVPVDAVLGDFGSRLVQRVGDAATWADRFAILDRALRARLAGAAAVDSGVVWSLRRIAAAGGNVAIGELAGELGWSHRTLIARYRDAVGLPPKTVARIVRFESLTARVTRDPGADWTATALACGYFDQAHLAREVREFAGVTPTVLRAELVNSVQDAASAPS